MPESLQIEHNPAKKVRNYTIAQDRLAGKSYHKIAKKFGISKSTVQHLIKNNDFVKDVIEQGEREMVSFIPRAIDNYRDFLTSKDEGIQLKASQDVLKTTRIIATHEAPTYIQNIYNQENKLLISGDYDRYLKYVQEQESEYTFDIKPDDVKDIKD